MAAKIIKANGLIRDITPAGDTFTLAELKEIVGGYIELVWLPHGMVLVVNEDGKMNGLPVNVVATELYKADVLVGDVLLCNENLIK